MNWFGPVLIAFGTLASAISVFYLERKRKIKSLRSAYISELESMWMITDDMIDENHTVDMDFINTLAEMPNTTIYESTAEDLGILSNIEAHVIITFYSVLQYTIHYAREELEKDEMSDQEVGEVVRENGKLLESLRIGTIALLRNPPKWPNKYTSEWYPEEDIDHDTTEFVSRPIMEKMESIDKNTLIDKEATKYVKICAEKMAEEEEN